MKKLLLPISFVCILATSCQKADQNIATPKAQTSLTHNLASQAYVSSIHPTVSARGYLSFTGKQALSGYTNDLSLATYQSIKEEFDDMGFSSLYFSGPSPITGPIVIDPSDIDALLLSTHGTVEIAGTVFKYMNDGTSTFLTASSASLNNGIYNDLEDGTFVSTYMNRMNHTDVIGGDLFDFLISHPTGFDSPNPNPPVPSPAFRLFWRETVEVVDWDFNGTRHVHCNRHWYFAGMEYWSDEVPC